MKQAWLNGVWKNIDSIDYKGHIIFGKKTDYSKVKKKARAIRRYPKRKTASEIKRPLVTWVNVQSIVVVPVIVIKQMDDERWNELAMAYKSKYVQ